MYAISYAITNGDGSPSMTMTPQLALASDDILHGLPSTHGSPAISKEAGMMQTGVFFGSAQLNGWNLHTGTGDRTFESDDIGFQPPFGVPPRVVVALTGLDSDHTSNVRIQVSPSNVEADEFNIMINTWADTVLHSVMITWIAFD